MVYKMKNQNKKLSVKKNKKKVMTVSCLALVLFAAPLVNISLLPSAFQNVAYEKRSLASVEPSFFEDLRETQLQILRYLAGRHDVVLSRIGKKPSQIEQFQFGVLSGKYNVTRNGGGISRLDIQEDVKVHNHLKKIKDKAEFLREYRSLWYIPFQYVEKLIEMRVGDKNSEVFVLKDSKKQSVGKATILSDENGGMISLNLTGFISY